jgi:hypothetical protein
VAKPITLNGNTFAKRGDAMVYLHGKMWSYPINAPIPASDVPLWAAVLQKHEWYDEYVEHGIAYFAATLSEQRPDLRNMVVVNDHGEQKPFTYHKYLTRGPLSKLAKIKAALRTEIAEQIAGHRAEGARHGHVHHAGKPFLQIVDEFLVANEHRWAEMETEAAGVTGYRLRDRTIAADWQDFHRKHAKLVIISAKANLQAGSGGYRMTFNAPD